MGKLQIVSNTTIFYHVSYWIVAYQKKAIKQHVGDTDSGFESVNTNCELKKSSRYLLSCSLSFFSARYLNTKPKAQPRILL